MARNLTASEREYIFDCAYGYLNGFNDCGEEDYPKLTVDELALYAYETIEFEMQYGDDLHKKIYFCGKKNIINAAKRMIRNDDDFREVCVDW